MKQQPTQPLPKGFSRLVTEPYQTQNLPQQHSGKEFTNEWGSEISSKDLNFIPSKTLTSLTVIITVAHDNFRKKVWC